MELDQLWEVADRVRNSARVSREDSVFVRKEIPDRLSDFPHLNLPKSIHHPAGFVVTGASVGTFVRCAALIAGKRVLGARYEGSGFYESIERDLAFRVMRSHFHLGYPKGTNCCVPCTLAVYPVLALNALRYFNGPELARDVREIVAKKKWRFSKPVNAKLLSWSLGQDFDHPR
jgi:hypothetical protein